ncbi:MAG: hypothetical protein ACKVW3_05240, partial [Phycisphaerales bacterium]
APIRAAPFRHDPRVPGGSYINFGHGATKHAPYGRYAFTKAALEGVQVLSVAAAEKLSAAVLADGTLRAWGENPILNCGDSPRNACIPGNPPPWNLQPPPAGNTYVWVDGTGHYMIARRADGTLKAFGVDSRCQVTNVPTGAVTKHAAAHMHGVAIMADGSIALWGFNAWGQAQTTSIPCPPFAACSGLPCASQGGACDKGQCVYPPPNPFPTVVAVEGSYYSTVGKRLDGTLFAWGSNEFGECCVIPDVVAQFSCNYYMGGAIVPPAINDGLYANCDESTGMPLLTVEDMICFNTKYAQADPDANCDESSASPVLSVSDVLCFHMKYAMGQ